MSSEAFLYLWYDAPNKKYYLGKHKGSPDDTYTHSSTVWESFTKRTIPDGVRRRILAYGTDEEMTKLEYDLLLNRQQKCWDRYYNVSAGWPIRVDNSGTNNPFYGRKHSEETRKKLSEAVKGTNNPNYGKKFSEEHRKNLSEAHTGRKVSEETRKKMSEALKGKKFSEEHRKKLSEVQKGKKLSEEHRKKLSEVQKGTNNPMYGRKHSEESKKKMSEWHKAKKLKKYIEMKEQANVSSTISELHTGSRRAIGKRKSS